MLVGGLIIAVVIGLASHYLGQAIGPIGISFTPSRFHIDFYGTARGIAVGIVIAYPQIIGMIMGSLLWRVAGKIKFYDEVKLRWVTIISSYII